MTIDQQLEIASCELNYRIALRAAFLGGGVPPPVDTRGYARRLDNDSGYEDFQNDTLKRRLLEKGSADGISEDHFNFVHILDIIIEKSGKRNLSTIEQFIYFMPYTLKEFLNIVVSIIDRTSFDISGGFTQKIKDGMNTRLKFICGNLLMHWEPDYPDYISSREEILLKLCTYTIINWLTTDTENRLGFELEDPVPLYAIHLLGEMDIENDVENYVPPP
jgi:hypothetical protein